MPSKASRAMEKWSLKTILPQLRRADVPPVLCRENTNWVYIYSVYYILIYLYIDIYIYGMCAIKEPELAGTKLLQSEHINPLYV